MEVLTSLEFVRVLVDVEVLATDVEGVVGLAEAIGRARAKRAETNVNFILYC